MPLDDQETFSFKVSKDFACAFAKVCFELDRSKSDVIRECIQIAIPMVLRKSLLKDRPYLSAIIKNGAE